MGIELVIDMSAINFDMTFINILELRETIWIHNSNFENKELKYNWVGN
jgi:hypothetical protein